MGSYRIPRLSVQLFIFDILLVPVGLAIASWLRVFLPFGQDLSTSATILPLLVYLAATLCWSISLVLNGAYDPRHVLRWYNEATRVILAGLLALLILAGFLYLTFRDISRLQFGYFLITTLLLLLGYRAILRIWYRALGRARPGSRNNILILGAGDLGKRIARTLQDHSRWGYNLIGFLDDDKAKQDDSIDEYKVLGTILDIGPVSRERNVDEVWVALPIWAVDRINLILNELERLPVRIKIVPDYFSLALVQAKAEVLDGIPIIGLREPVIEGFPRVIKRAFDILVGSLLILFSLPILLIIALAIRLDSPGPVIFKQPRVGENNRIFQMLKFRTMLPDSEDKQAEVLQETEDGQIIHKHMDDPRVTSVGRFLRRYSLDELPQIVNVIKGDMSLVGPRPEMPWLVDKYDSWQRKRFAVPQGITGWWQITGRSDKPMHLHTEDDLYYVYNYSLWLDIQILLRTPIAVLRGKGAF
jgi:exopolysaccharide biosynthesis polyprenyl glycosylphosphotransferase